MQVREINEKIKAQHGVVSSFPSDFFGYFGWPTLARMEDGTLVAAASGLRNAHVCPFGRNVICISSDDGQSWTSPQVAHDSPLDDRDTGVVPLGQDKLLISWFTVHSQDYEERAGDQIERWREGYARMTDENAERWAGAWISTSHDRGESWNDPIKVPLTAPHGPIRLRGGELLYFGKEFLVNLEGFWAGQGAIAATQSTDEGRTWGKLGTVPLYPGTVEGNYHEPHVAELPDGRLLGLIRIENSRGTTTPIEDLGLIHFSMMQTLSEDGGRTWSPIEPLNFHGCPPHLVSHSSGALICSYGFRQEPYGERVMISRDGGGSWDYHYILRDDGPDTDLGYPSTVELGDGSLLTMYYQKLKSVEDKCSLLWSRWELPE
jgi:sialidase-1